MITVKEAVQAAAETLGLGEKVNAYLNGETSEGQAETEHLTRCFSVVENELMRSRFT